MSDRQWSEKHPSDQQAQGKNIRLFVATARIAAERPHGTYDDTRAGHDAFSKGVVDDYDHGNHHLARATIRPADPGLVTRAALSGTRPARHRRHHYRRTRPVLGHQPDRERPRRRGPAGP